MDEPATNILPNITLYIPHVFPNFTRDYIASVFAQIGDVKQVDMVPKHDLYGDIKFYAVYVHFYQWHSSDPKVQTFYQNVVTKEARFYHDDPWYWVVLRSRPKAPDSRKRLRGILVSPSSKPRSEPKKLSFSEENQYVDPPNVEEEAYRESSSPDFEEEQVDHALLWTAEYVRHLQRENISMRYELERLRSLLDGQFVSL